MSRGWPFQKKLAKSRLHSVRRRISSIGWGALITAIVIGVLANFFYGKLPQVWQTLIGLVSWSLLPWVITIVALLCCTIVFPLWKRDIRNWSMKFADLEYQLREMHQLFVLDDSLMRLLPSMITITRKANTQEAVQNTTDASRNHMPRPTDSDELDLDKRMHNLLDRLLDLTAKAFPRDVRRGILFRPDTDRKQLIIWEQYGWVNENMKGQARFDISEKPETKPGVAGDAFINGETVIAHIRQENGQYTCDKDSYVFLGEKNNPPPHCSLICVPITGLIPGSSVDADGKLGVICLDSSKDPKLFDSPEIQEKLKLLSRHIAAALLIHDQLSQACSASACIFARRRPPAA